MSVNVNILDDKKVEDIIYFVKDGDTISSVADKFCVKINDLIFDNDLSYNDVIESGDILWIRKRNTAIYIVKPLDTLDSISQKFNVSVEHIKRLNDVESVFIGQKIII